MRTYRSKPGVTARLKSEVASLRFKLFTDPCCVDFTAQTYHHSTPFPQISYPLGIHFTRQVYTFLYLFTHNVGKCLINNTYCVELWYFDPHFVSTHFPTISENQTPHSTPKSTQACYSTF